MLEVYGEYGAVGVIVLTFVMLIMNLIKSQKEQSQDLDNIRQNIAKTETKMSNVEGVLLKMLDRWNRSDETRDRRHEDLMKELTDQSDSISYLKGRINGRSS